jgi:uncharacterized protein
MEALRNHPSIRGFVIRSWVACGLALCSAAVAYGSPSFDCNRASTPTQKAICGSPELSDLDGKMGQLFSDAVAAARGVAALDKLRAEQRAWIVDRDQACGGQESCLGVLLRSRMRALKEYVSAQTQVANEPPSAVSNASNAEPPSRTTPVPAPPATGGIVHLADGTQWRSSPRCAEYMAQHNELHAQWDAGDKSVRLELRRLDAAAIYDECMLMLQGDASERQESRMSTCNAQASGKVGEDRKQFMTTCLKGTP